MMIRRARNNRSRIFLSLFCLSILFVSFLSFPVSAIDNKSSGSRQLIRVGYPIQNGLTEIDEDGHYSGYTYEYLMEVAQYAGWDYEFITVDGTINEQLSTLLDMLMNGKIDLMGCLAYNESLGEMFDYPSSNYGTSYYNLSVLDKNGKIDNTNFFTYNPLRVGIFGTPGQQAESLQLLAKMNNFSVEQISYSTEKDMVTALDNNEIDAIFVTDIDHLENVRPVAQINPRPFYFATTKGRSDIVNALNSAQASITQTDPAFTALLHQKYFGGNEKLFLSDTEKSYIDAAPVLKAVAAGGNAPLQYKDPKSGEARGLSIDILDFISAKTGLQFELTIADTFEEVESLIQSGAADIVVGITDDDRIFDSHPFLVSTPYITIPLNAVFNSKVDPSDLSGKKLASTKNLTYTGPYKGRVSYFETTEDCIRAVASGRMDYTYLTSYSTQYYQTAKNYRNLNVIPQSEDWSRTFCFGLVDKNNARLLTIMNKAIQCLDNDSLQSFLYANAYQPDQITFSSYAAANPQQVALFFLVIMMAFVVVLLLLNRHKDRMNLRVRELETERYRQVSEISNEFLFEYDIQNDRLSLPEKSARFLGWPMVTENLSQMKIPSKFTILEKGKKGGSEETLYTFPDHSSRWIRVIFKQVDDNDGQPIYVIGKIVDIQEEKTHQEQLQYKAERDSMTGLYNAATCRQLTADYLAPGSDQKEDGGAFFILDVDYFKKINDTYGHYNGDLALKRIADILKRVFRKNDILGRFGGDEFAVFMKGAGRADVAEKCQLLRQIISETEFAPNTGPLTASIGVAIAEPNQDFDDLYRKADQALYLVKERGRNNFHIWNKEDALSSEDN